MVRNSNHHPCFAQPHGYPSSREPTISVGVLKAPKDSSLICRSQTIPSRRGPPAPEHNLGSGPLRFIQIWITPKRHGLKPNYGLRPRAFFKTDLTPTQEGGSSPTACWKPVPILFFFDPHKLTQARLVGGGGSPALAYPLSSVLSRRRLNPPPVRKAPRIFFHFKKFRRTTCRP